MPQFFVHIVHNSTNPGESTFSKLFTTEGSYRASFSSLIVSKMKTSFSSQPFFLKSFTDTRQNMGRQTWNLHSNIHRTCQLEKAVTGAHANCAINLDVRSWLTAQCRKVIDFSKLNEPRKKNNNQFITSTYNSWLSKCFTTSARRLGLLTPRLNVTGILH